jgi:hypothetical protein
MNGGSGHGPQTWRGRTGRSMGVVAYDRAGACNSALLGLGIISGIFHGVLVWVRPSTEHLPSNVSDRHKSIT